MQDKKDIRMTVGRPRKTVTKKDEYTLANNAMLRDACVKGVDTFKDSELVELSINMVKSIRLQHQLRDYTHTDAPLILQLVRCVSSVGANFVEGVAKVSPQATLSMLRISRGSAYEAQYHAKCLELDVTPYTKLIEVLDSYIVNMIDGLPIGLLNDSQES